MHHPWSSRVQIRSSTQTCPNCGNKGEFGKYSEQFYHSLLVCIMTSLCNSGLKLFQPAQILPVHNRYATQHHVCEHGQQIRQLHVVSAHLNHLTVIASIKQYWLVKVTLCRDKIQTYKLLQLLHDTFQNHNLYTSASYIRITSTDYVVCTYSSWLYYIL